MPEIAWETLIGALALVALVAGTQYIRSGAPGTAAVRDIAGEVVREGKKKVAGKKKKGKKLSAGVVDKAEWVGERVKDKVESRAHESSESDSQSQEKESRGGSFAAVAEAAAREDNVAHEEVVEPALASVKSNKKKKNKAKPVEAAPVASQLPVTKPPAQATQPEDTSNDATLAAQLSEPTPSEPTSESDAEPTPDPFSSKPTRTADGWSKPKKPIAGSAAESASFESQTRANPSISSANRFSALSLSLPPTHAHKKPPHRTPTTGGKHRAHVEETGAPTKLQKKNAAQAAAKRAGKEAEERDRLERLGAYRREQEREKMRTGGKVTVAANNRAVSGGMKASVDMGGKLVWD